MQWYIIVHPTGPYRGSVEKEGDGFAIILMAANFSKEVCRVGFDRSDTKHPAVSLREQLGESIVEASAAVMVLNDLLATDGELV